MLFEWKKKDSSTILEKMDQSPNLFPYVMKDAGIAPGECRETARYLGLKCAGDGEIAADVLLDVLKAHGPIWVAGNWGSGSHVIVVTACDAEDGRIRYINPYANNDLTDSPGTVSWLTQRGNTWKSCDASVMYF
jgi:hypothetical protein